MKHTDYVFDIECLPNVFTLICTRVDDDAKWKFVITPWLNQGKELNVFLNQLKMSNGRMVGYNNLGYDYPMIHLVMLYSGNINNAILYNKSKAIISADFNDRSHRLWDNETLISQLDLRSIHHFDNKAKMTSLKLLEFNMMMDSIQEFELDFDKPLKPSELPKLLDYNDHDVGATLKFYHYSRSEIDFRDELTEKHGTNFTNFNDTRIGQEIFVMELAKAGVKASKWNQTIREKIVVDEIILPYIEFETPEFNEVLNFFRDTVINPEMIKGFFGSRDKAKSKCTANITHELANVMLDTDVTVNYTDGTKSNYKDLDASKEVKFMRPVNVHCVLNGFRFDFGAGGIHGSLTNTVVIPSKDETLRDSDAASFYPWISIANNLFPFHLTEAFCPVFKGIYNQRTTWAKGTPENAMLKLALNGVYGKSNDKHSPFFDPQYTMSITINGQLLLCMLAEQLMKIPNLRMVQINTDGLTYVCPNEYLYHADLINKWWEDKTQLVLEHVDYSKMAVQNVNNYLAVTKPYLKDGKLVPPKVKRIGSYAHQRASENPGTRELPWHKNHSAIVVAKAAESALVRGENIERFIRRHLVTNPMDFMLRTKVNKCDQLALETPMMWGKDVVTTKSENMQHVTRYFVSNKGGYLIKIMEPTKLQCEAWLAKPHWRHKVNGTHKMSAKAPSGMYVRCEPPTNRPQLRRIGIDAGFKVTECNELIGLNMTDVNIDYYVSQTRKLVDPLVIQTV
jgi:hypothetical protein